MRTIALLMVGAAIGWTASGVDWTRTAVAQDAAIGDAPALQPEVIAPAGAAPQAAAAPAPGEERSIRRQRDGVLRRRGILPSREAAPAASDASEAPAFSPGGAVPASAEAMPAGIPGAEVAPPLGGLDAVPGPALLPAGNAPSSRGRYQLSAFNTSSTYGYYVLDTVTGRVWIGLQGSAPRLVVEKLPER